MGQTLWFRQARPDGRRSPPAQYYAGVIQALNPGSIAWTWLNTDLGSQRPVTRNLGVLRRERPEVLTDTELSLLHRDPSYSRDEVRTALRRQPSGGSGAPLPPSAATLQHRQFLPYNLDGFFQVQNVTKWQELLFEWLPSFQPTVFLVGRIPAEAPTGLAASAWTSCVRSITNLLSQTERLDEQDRYISTTIHDQLLMLTRCLPILLLRVPRRATHAAKVKIVQHNCNRFLQGHWRGLAATAERELLRDAEAASARPPQRAATPGAETTRSHRFAEEQARKLNLSKAMHLLRSPGLATGDPDEILDRLQALHPSETINMDHLPPPGETQPGKGTFDFITGEWLLRFLNKARAGTAVDQWGWDSREMWTPFRKDNDLLDAIARLWIRPVAAGYLPPPYRADLAGGRLVALSKFPKPGIRPICITDAWRRLAAKGLGTTSDAQFQAFFQESQTNALQFGGNTRNGATNMFHLLSSVADSVTDGQRDSDDPRRDPLVILALDSANAFNTLSRAQLTAVLQQGCAHFVNHPRDPLSPGPAQPAGWDILWRHIQAHYGCKGHLRFFHDGKVSFISSETGVQQGDPLGSTLFALALHPVLTELGRHHQVLITAYADNVVISGPLSRVFGAQEALRQSMIDIGLHLNPTESELYIPEWSDVPFDQVADLMSLSSSSFCQGENGESFRMLNGDLIPWRRPGLKILGCPLGSAQYCTDLLQRTVSKIEADLAVLSTFPPLHQRIKLAVFCSNTRASYFLRAAATAISTPLMHGLDEAFDSFMAATLDFPHDFTSNVDGPRYSSALQQIRLGIKQGGYGLTSAALIVPAALYAAICAFTKWLHEESHLPLRDLDWLSDHASRHLLIFRHIHVSMDSALAVLEQRWGFESTAACPQVERLDPASRTIPNVHGIVDWTPKLLPGQHHLVSLMKVDVRAAFLTTLPAPDRTRLASVSLQRTLADSPASAIGTSSLSSSNSLKQCPMGLFALTCPYELSNQAVLTSSALRLGYPVPHARYLKAREAAYHHIDLWGDALLNNPSHAAGSWQSSHNRVAQELAHIATAGGIPTTAIESQIPTVSDTSGKRGDLMTKVGGRIPLRCTPPFDRFTRLVLDVQLGHVFATQGHVLKPQTLQSMERAKRVKYTDLYRARGFAFAPLVTNSWGVLGPDVLRFLWAVADHAARNALSFPLDFYSSLSPPSSSDHAEPSEAQLLAFRILRGRLNLDSRLRLLTAVQEAFAERVFGRTHALASLPEYIEFQAAARAVWMPASAVAPPSPPSPPGGDGLRSRSESSGVSVSGSSVPLVPSLTPPLPPSLLVDTAVADPPGGLEVSFARDFLSSLLPPSPS